MEMTSDAEDTPLALPANDPTPAPLARRNTIGTRGTPPVIRGPEAWSPPEFGDERRSRMGASVVEEFVLSHDGTDVLRELVQNEFDGGGDRLTVTFGEHALEITGNGSSITPDGWERLSV